MYTLIYVWGGLYKGVVSRAKIIGVLLYSSTYERQFFRGFGRKVSGGNAQHYYSIMGLLSDGVRARAHCAGCSLSLRKLYCQHTFHL